MAVPQTLPEACADLLLFALEIQKKGVDIRDGEVLRERTKAKLSELEAVAERLGYARGDIDDTVYAIVATIDELFGYRAEWGFPSEADRREIVQLMEGDARMRTP